MGSNNYVTPTDAIGVIAEMGKVQGGLERRGSVRVASDLMGPGLAPNAVQITNWSGQETLFNGMFYSVANQVTNSPDDTKNWIGENIAVSQGFGMQVIRDVATAFAYRRTWTVAGDATRTFTAWTLDVPAPSAFLNVFTGSETVLTGIVPPAGTQVQMRTATAVVTSSAGAIITITFPAFTNALVSFVAMSGDFGIGVTQIAGQNPTGIGLGQYQMAVYGPTGVTKPSQGVRVNYIATGW